MRHGLSLKQSSAD